MSNKPNVEELAIIAVQLDTENQIDKARIYSSKIVDIVKKQPKVLLSIEQNGIFGKSFLLMFEQGVTNDENDLQLITELCYYFLSKAIEENIVKSQFLLDRIILLFNSEDFLKDTIKDALNIELNVLDRLTSPLMIAYGLNEKLDMMRIADLEHESTIYKHIPFLIEKKAELDKFLQRQCIGATTSQNDIITAGNKLHLMVYQYIENKIKKMIAETPDESLSELELDFVFHSSDHIRYENSKHVAGPHGGAQRAIKVEANISGNKGYTVTVFNTDGGQAVVQMAPKQMELQRSENRKIILKGYGYDALGSSFADYGLTIYHEEGNIEKCVLHMFDRGVDIEYLKLDEERYEHGFEEIEMFLNKFRILPMDVKRALAQKTDEFNNTGVSYYERGDIETAIIYYNKALEIYPINDDSLKNLIVCYRQTNNFEKMQNAQERLEHLRKLGI